jgi:Protein of unknown function (DUF3105)
MARKDRAPTPPKRVQAPQQRRTPQSPEAVRKQKMIIYGIAASGVLALGVVLLLVAFGGGGGGGGDARAALEDAGCTLQIVQAQPNRSDHSDVPTPDTKVNWNTVPPSNGPHFQQTVIFGAYDEQLEQQRLVHNLEHGGVSIQWGPQVPEEQVAALRAWYEDGDKDGLVLAPYRPLGDQIALAAWRDTNPEDSAKGEGIVAKCPTFDAGAFDAYLDAYGFQGPEPFPRDVLQVGGN